MTQTSEITEASHSNGASNGHVALSVPEPAPAVVATPVVAQVVVPAEPAVPRGHITIASNKLIMAVRAVQQFGVHVGHFDYSQKKISFDPKEQDTALLRAILRQKPDAATKAKIVAIVGAGVVDWDTPMTCSKDVAEAVTTLMEAANGKPFVETKIGSRWYPVSVSKCYYNEWFGIGSTNISVTYSVGDATYGKRAYVGDSYFADALGTKKKFSLRDVLAIEGLRSVTSDSLAAYTARIEKMDKFRECGLVLDASGPALAAQTMFWEKRLVEIRLGSPKRPSQVISESELETAHDPDEEENESIARIPTVRVFSPDLKQYVYVDVDDLKVHEFNQKARERLVLPEKMRDVLYRVFDAQADSIFGDLFQGRHGGMVIMANGPSGVGKTLTAEVAAETTNRPLYSLEMGELGTSLASVEESLQRIFVRAARWNAILLFDEADIFLAKRTESDLERSAIVGVFLRLLDRYEGMFFLTTNRADVIDPAFKSRITLQLNYPALDAKSRASVWGKMLESAGMQVDGSLETLAETDVNGRQIRNVVRLARVLHGEKVTVEQMRESMALQSYT